MLTATRMCRPADQLRLRPQRSCSKKISVLAIAIKRLRDNAYVGDTGLLDRVHHCGKSAERHIFISPYEDELVLRIADFLFYFDGNFIDVNRIAAKKHPLLFVNADYHALFGNLFHRASARDVYFDAGLQYWGCHHKDDQQHQYDVHQRSYVDVRKRSLGPPVGRSKCHYRLTSGPPGRSACWRSTAFIISREKSSQRAANSRIALPIRL